ncbi:MAG: protein-export chaperone SecB [Alphaproteobacteria bacterium]|nr:protein-export chaperone SecB [Alphaproteobacteria bacterium]
MSDNGSTNPTDAPASGGAANQQGAPLAIRGQYIRDLSFEIPKAPESISGLTQAPNVDIQIEVGVRDLQADTYEVTLTVRCEAKTEAESIFILEIAYAGVFTLTGLQAEHLKPALYIECPRYLFPFARSIVATLTQESSLPPMLINPIDFAALYRARYQEAQQGAAS